MPVGEIKNDAVENTDNKTTITLGRYRNYTVTNGILPNPAQTASKTAYDTLTTIDIAGYDFTEISSNFAGDTIHSAASSYGNTKALDLQEWISTTLDNGGYYIARYEASKNGTKAASKPTTVASTSVNDSSKVTDGMLWNNITQPEAAIVAKAMYPYSSTAKYYSDLINSYAWDTAIIFIEAYSDSTYTSKRGTNISSKIAKTGQNADKRCNIQDMAGNVREWSTETCVDSDLPCSLRGDNYGSYNTVASRGSYSSSYSDNYMSFRGSLCVK